MSFKKILIIRLSSIGDIVLTSPVVRVLKEQTDASIYFLTKESYVHVLINNPYIKKPKVEHMLLNLFARKLCNAKVKAPNNGPK